MLMSAALLALLNHAKFFKIRISLYSAELYHKTAVQLSLKLIKVGNKENWVDKQQEKKKKKPAQLCLWTLLQSKNHKTWFK